MIRYQLTIRPAAPENTPEGPDRRFTNEDLPAFENRGHGSVYYSEPLTVEQINHYSLIPVTQSIALNGRVFQKPVGLKGQFVTYTLEVNENAGILVKAVLGELMQDEYLHYGVIETNISSGKWQEVNVQQP